MRFPTTDPAAPGGWRCRAFGPVPSAAAGSSDNKPKGHRCPSQACASFWRPGFTSATKPAAGTPRCAASSSRNGAASTSSTSSRRRSSSTQAYALRPERGGTERLRPLRRHEEAVPGRDRRGGEARRHALRQPPLARRPPHQLAHDLGAPGAPARATATQGGRAARPPATQGADRERGRAREARGEPRRSGRHEEAARRRLRHRPEEGAAGDPRGAAARPARRRARRHELRPRRRRLHHPRKRRRDPLVQPDRARDRRRGTRRARARSPPRRWPPRAATGAWRTRPLRQRRRSRPAKPPRGGRGAEAEPEAAAQAEAALGEQPGADAIAAEEAAANGEEPARG